MPSKEQDERANSSERRTTAKEVAEAAGVSISAVSRTFTKGASVSPATREKVLAATRKLGYQPNLLARALMTKRTELVGLISNNFDNPAFMEIFDLFTRRLQQRGRRPLLVNLSGDMESATALDLLLQYNVDGVIIASSMLPPQFAQACAEARLPVVQAFGRAGAAPSVHVVGADNVQGGRLAAQLLSERGYRKIAFLGGPGTATSTQDRLRGFRQYLKRVGLAPVAVVYGSSYSHKSGAEQMSSLLGEDIDAVFCGDDILAMGAIDACREAGVQVPEKVGVIGFNDFAMAAWPAFRLTTIRQPISEIIVKAVDLILDIIDEPNTSPEPQIFACEPRVRATLREASPPVSRRTARAGRVAAI